MAETRYAHRFRRVVARLRARGFTVVEEPGCYSRTVGTKDLLGLTGHTVHHTAGGNDSSDRRVVRDGRTGLRGPLSQWLTERDGTLRLIAAGYANHAGPSKHARMGNSYSVGNEIVSKGLRESDFTAAQLRSSRALAEETAREGDHSTEWVRGHKEEGVPLGRKVDPAFSMPSFRASLGATTTAPAPAPAPTPPPAPKETFLMALTDEQQTDLYERVKRIEETSADGRGHAKAVRIDHLPGGTTYDRLRNVEAIAARNKNLTIEVLQRPAVSPAQVAEVLTALGGLPTATVDEAVRRVAELADQAALERAGAEQPALTTPDRDEETLR